MNWAMKQATGDPRAQCVLYVVADVANEEGVAWPSADWMAKKSQQSRATVYRRLSQMQDMGLLVMFPRYIDSDGKIWNAAAPGRRRTSPEIRLQLGIFIKQEEPSSDDEEAAETDETPSLAETTPSSHSSDIPVAVQRQGSSHCSDSKTPHLNQGKNPPTPLTGGSQPAPPVPEESEIAALRSIYPIPITDVPKTLSVWSAMTEAERNDALLGARGYAAFIEDQRKRGRSRNVKDCHRWLRDRGWIGYIDEGKKVETIAARTDVIEGSEEWAAWDVYYRCCGRSTGIESSYMRGDPGSRIVNCPQQWPPVGHGISVAPDDWIPVFEGSGQFAAWLRKLRELPDVRIGLLTKYIEGKPKHCLIVPFEWPPAKTTDLAKTG